MTKDIRGLSIALIIGRNGGFHVGRSVNQFRICLWWVELAIYFFDLDEFHIQLADAARGRGRG